VIEQAAKGLYPDVVERTLLMPLGMRRSTFAPTMAMTYPLSQDHRLTGDSIRVLRPFSDDATTWPSGSLFSSAIEMAQYASAIVNDGMLDGQRVLPHAVVELLGTNQVHVPPLADGPCGYSFGLSVCTRDSTRLLSHYGFRVGSGAILTMAPARGFAVVILANRNGAIFRSTEQKVLELALGIRPERREASRDGKTHPTLAAVAGIYVSGKDSLRLTFKNDSLFYEYGAEAPQRATIDAAGNVAVLTPAGETVQEFMVVAGRSGQQYLHDGLNAFRRVTPRR
jgi:CubicO group peptidase (beta-lactamase class C family)